MVRSPFVHVIAVAALGLSLVGFGMARIAADQLDALLASLGGEVEFTVYLATDAPPDQVDELEKALVNRTHGTLARISPATALGRLAAQLGEQGKSLTELGDNPLPWSLELKLPPNAREPAALKLLAERTRGCPSSPASTTARRPSSASASSPVPCGSPAWSPSCSSSSPR
jgi:cell division transport system permease protein